MVLPKSRNNSLSDHKTKSSNSPSLKQGRLSFVAAKSRGAAGKDKKGTKSPQFTLSRQVSFDEENYDDDTTDSEPRAIVTHNITRPRERKSVKVEVVDGGVPVISDETPQADLIVLDKQKRFSKIYGASRDRMGNQAMVHGEGQSKFQQILRVFDLSYEYGPCVGVTRLERWERANALGLNPPPEVREILLTKQGVANDDLKHTVFYGEVI